MEQVWPEECDQMLNLPYRISLLPFPFESFTHLYVSSALFEKQAVQSQALARLPNQNFSRQKKKMGFSFSLKKKKKKNPEGMCLMGFISLTSDMSEKWDSGFRMMLIRGRFSCRCAH